MSAPASPPLSVWETEGLDAGAKVDHRDIVREFVRAESARWTRERAQLVAFLRRVGCNYTASTFEMHCPYCGEIGGGQCEMCTNPPNTEDAPEGIDRLDWIWVERSVSECWLWTGPTNSKGYAWRAGRALHRVYYAAHNPGVDIADLVIHHTCRVKHCVNPDHLEALTKSQHGSRHYREANP